jgi:hypothetical protein
MNTIKKILGVVWMILAPLIISFLFWQASDKISIASPTVKANTALQWAIILFIFTPICIGLFIFGLYSSKGYYNTLSENNKKE